MNVRWLAYGILGIGLGLGCVSCSTQNAASCDRGVCTLEQLSDAQNGEATPKILLRARSYRWTEAPDLEVAKWLTEMPDMEGTFVLVEFWRTWCGACKRNTVLFNTLQKTYADDLVVIAIAGESEEAVNNDNGPEEKYFRALDKPQRHPPVEEAFAKLNRDLGGVDTAAGRNSVLEKGAYEYYFGVFGWSHAILLEPEEHVILWEGFPALKGHELSVEKTGRYIEAGRRNVSKQNVSVLDPLYCNV